MGIQTDPYSAVDVPVKRKSLEKINGKSKIEEMSIELLREC